MLNTADMYLQGESLCPKYWFKTVCLIAIIGTLLGFVLDWICVLQLLNPWFHNKNE